MGSINLSINRNRKTGRVYAQIIETFRDPVTKKNSSHTLKAFGNISEQLQKDPLFLDKLRQEVLRLRMDKEQAATLRHEAAIGQLPADAQYQNEKAAPRWFYGSAAIRKVWEEMHLDKYFKNLAHNRKLDFDLDLAVFSMVCQRFFGYYSRHKQHLLAPEHIFRFETVSLKQLYEALALCAERKELILKRLDEGVQHYVGRQQDLIFYDVTTFYFESFIEGDLRRRGMSKEHRTHETQVVLGLLIDQNGIPITYELFPGNEAETKTILPIVQSHRQTHPSGSYIVVADRGLNSKDNLKDLSREGFQYIVAQSLKKMHRDDVAVLLSPEGWKVSFDPQTAEVLSRIKDVPMSSEILFAKTEAERKKALSLKPENDLRVIVSWSAKRYFNDIKEIELAWEKSKALISRGAGTVDSSFKKGTRRYIKVSQPEGQNSGKGKGKKRIYELDRELYDKQRKFAGYYAIVTSCKTSTYDAKDIYKHLRELSQIEDNFRVMKSLFDSRPVYVWKDDNIRGHFVTCVLSLAIEQVMRKKLRDAGKDCSPEWMLELLKANRVSPVIGAKGRHRLLLKTSEEFLSDALATTPSLLSMQDEADEMMKVFGVEPLLSYDTIEGVKKKLGVKLPLRLL